jgi:hypothetical protein
MVKSLQSNRLLKFAFAIIAIVASAFCGAGNAYAVSIEPAEGTCESLQSFTITFDEGATVASAISQDAFPYIQNASGNRVASVTTGTADGNKFSFSIVGSVSEAGTYTLYVPAGSYTLNGVAGDALQFNYTIGTSDKTLEYTVKPEADEDGNVSTISPIVVTFGNAGTIVDATAGHDGTSSVRLTNNGNKNKWDAQFAYTFDEPLSQEKTYVFKFKARSTTADGQLQFQYQNGTTYSSQGGYKDFTVGTAWAEYETEFTPSYEDSNRIILNFGAVEGSYWIDDVQFGVKEDGNFTNLLSGDASNFNGGTTGGWGSWGSNKKEVVVVDDAIITLEYSNDKLREGSAGIPVTAQVSGKDILFFVEESDQVEGKFKLTVGAGAFLIDGVESPVIVEEFNYAVAQQDYATILPEAGEYTSLYEFTVTFNNAQKVEFDFSNGKYPKLEGVEGTAAGATMWPSGYSTEGNVMKFKVGSAEFTTPGKYQLRIPGESFKLDDEAGQEVLSGVYTIVASAANQKYTVSPEAGDVTDLTSIEVKYEGVSKIEENPNASFDKYVRLTYFDSRFGDDAEVMLNVGEMIQAQSIVIIPQDELYTQTYTLTIPAGTFLIDGIENEEIVRVYNYTAPEQDYATITPPAGSYVSLHEFSVTINDATEVKFVENAIKNDFLATLVNVDTEEIVASMLPREYSAEGNTLTFKIGYAEFRKAGTYQLHVPGAMYTVDGVAGQDIVSDNYVIVEQDLLDYTSNINDNDVVSDFSELVLTFDTDEDIVLYDEGDDYPEIYVWSEEYGWDYAQGLYYEADGNKLVFALNAWNPVLANGQYKIVVPAGVVGADGATNAEIVIVFTVDQKAPEFTTTIDPQEGTVSSLSEFNITFSGITTVQLNNYTNTTKFYIEDESGNKTYSTESYINSDEVGKPLHIEFDTIGTSGKYTLVLPEGSYTVDGYSGDELRFNYVVDASGVASIFADGAEKVDVYNLRGVRVLQNASAEDVRNLETNIYIVNGKKYMIRK